MSTMILVEILNKIIFNLAEPIGCEKCNFHGSCYTLETKEICECFQWYAGDFCQINLKGEKGFFIIILT